MNIFKRLKKETASEIKPPALPQVTGRYTQKAADLCTAASTHIGRRTYQQDCYRIPNDVPSSTFLCVLCDGMGGMENGELASQTAADTLVRAFEDAGNKPKEPLHFLEENIYAADHLVSRLTDAHGNPLHSGSTLLAAIADGDKLYWASVGDSRIYLLRGGQLQQLTRDQNYGEILLQQLQTGQITIDEANANPQKDALTHFIGIGSLNNINMPAAPLQLEADDIILMCSDGLYRTLEESEICTILAENQTNLPFAAWALVQAAIDKNMPHQDNTTAVLLRRYMPAAETAAAPEKADRPAPAKPAKTLHLPPHPTKAQKTEEEAKPSAEKQPDASKNVSTPAPTENAAPAQSKPPAGQSVQENAEKADWEKHTAPEKTAALPQTRPKPEGLAVTELIR